MDTPASKPVTAGKNIPNSTISEMVDDGLVKTGANRSKIVISKKNGY